MSLYDYELIIGDHGKRLLSFGKYAGRAGLIDFLHGLGQSMFSLPFPNVSVLEFSVVLRMPCSIAIKILRFN